MRIKAVIYNKSRVPKIYYPKKKEIKEERFEVNGGTYFITEDDTFHITKRWIGPFRFHYITYYYNVDCACPLDFFNLVTSDDFIEMPKMDDEGEAVLNDDGSQVMEQHRIMKVKANAPTPQMFNEAFTPAFYRMVRGSNKNVKADILYLLAWAAALTGAYNAWRITGIWNIVKDLIPGVGS